jgi:DNA-binding MarR family transcriptional regulator
MATAPMPFDAITDVGQPFYDFFDTQLLQPLDKEQTITLLRRFVDLDENDGCRHLEELTPLAMAIHDLVDGNPRLIVMMCELVVYEGIRSAGDVLMHLADRITPTYQATLGGLAPQERAVLEAMAAMRGAKRPRTPGNISQQMGLSVGQISSLLNRLTERRLIKHETDPRDRRSRSYSLRDGFLDIWLAIHLNQALRRRMVDVCECLAAYYRKTDGPFLKSGKANDRFQMVEWPEARQLFQDPASGQHYLCEFQRSLTQWLNSRSGDFEELAVQLIELGGISVQTTCQVLVGRYRDALSTDDGSDAKAELLLKKAHMHFLLAENKECEQDLRAVLSQAESIDETLAKTCVNNLVLLLDHEGRHAEIRALIAQYPAYQADFWRVARAASSVP